MSFLHLQTMTSELITGINLPVKKNYTFLLKHFVSTTNIVVIVLIIVWMWVTTHQGNQPWVLDSTWGLKWHFHSHLSWTILAVSDRNYCFVSSRILFLHLAFTINGKKFTFSKTSHWILHFRISYHWIYTFVCVLSATFFLSISKKKNHTSFYLNQIFKSMVRIAST